MQLAKARRDRFILAPSLNFWPPLFVSDARSLHCEFTQWFYIPLREERFEGETNIEWRPQPASKIH